MFSVFITISALSTSPILFHNPNIFVEMAPNSVRSVDVTTSKSAVASATAKATTIAELISTVPQTWRSACGPRLTIAYRVATKLCTVQNTIAQYNRHRAEGSYPPSIVNSARDPKIQFSKEFLGTEDGRLALASIAATVQAARKALLADALIHKEGEFKSLQAMVTFDEVMWRKLVAETADRVGEAFGIVPSEGNTETLRAGWEKYAPKYAKEELEIVISQGAVFHYRAVALARSLADRSLLDKTRNLSVKKQTDIVMKDADQELTTREVVREELKTLESQVVQRLAGMMGTSSGKRQGAPLTPDRQCKKVRPTPEERQRQRRLEPPHSEGEDRQEWRQEEEGRSLTVAAFLSQCSKEFRPWLTETYPTVYGTLSESSRMKIAVALSKTWELETVRTASPGVFKWPDVDLPEDIEYAIAVNHKFILQQVPSLNDMEEAKDRLCRTVRNRWFFRDKTSRDFIPKFHVPNPQWRPPLASRKIEQGLDAAMRVIDDQCRRALASIAIRPAALPFSKWAKVQDFLESNRLLAKLTDKNLGLAVFPLDWYDTTILQMLADASVYEHVQSIPVSLLVKELLESIPKWRLPVSMEKYLMTKVKLVIPEFHAIPKVHKTPWTLRPIVPSHSWVTTSSSEVLDHLLQPLLEHFPWVVASSKDVIRQIEHVRVADSAPVWIMTGDVTSFYTNIPPKHCANVIAGAWKLYQHTSSITHTTIRRMVRFVMDNNFLQYRGQTFRQVSGLAMGTSCAPVLANIYAAYFERKARVVHREGILLYVRYIDDILCLFQGTSKEARTFIQEYSLGHLEIRWSVDRFRKEFLDIELIRGNQQLGLRACHTRLFRKEMNRHLYIPWSSAHPLHVKKGFVKAELTRFAIICSRPEYFAEARQEFYGNLRRRGYPVQALREWFQQVQYDDRPVLLLPKIKSTAAPLMLSGHYNPVWEFVDVKEVLTAARMFWTREELPESLKEPLIRSLGRTTSLFDLISAWNKTILLSSSEEGPGGLPPAANERR